MNAVVDFVRGAALVLDALRLIVQNHRIRKLALGSAVLTSVVLVFAGWIAWRLAGLASDWLVSDPRPLFRVLAAGLQATTFLVAFALGALTIPNLLLAPLQDPISVATEESVTHNNPATANVQGALRAIVISLSHTLTRLTLTLFGFAAALPLLLIPTVGPLAWTVFAWVWSSVCLAAEHLSTPLARNGYPFGEVYKRLRANKALGLGLGSALHVVLWLPIVNCFLLPVATVAGTLLSLRLARNVEHPLA